MLIKNKYSYDEIIECSKGLLFGEGNAKLPKPPMLMFDRITDISKTSGKYKKGGLVAELDIKPNLWFFGCHFHSDPVMPGCLGLDAMWQLIGFFLAWLGCKGRGRALGCGSVKFSGQVLPTNKLITYYIDFSRIINRKLNMGIADAIMEVDGTQIYCAKSLKVGLFTEDIF